MQESPPVFSLSSLAAQAGAANASGEPAPAARFVRGVTLGFHARNGYYSSAAAREEAARIRASGAEWVCLVSTVFQETCASTRQYRDFAHTPDDAELRRFIEHLHGIGLKVMLRPMTETQDGHGRLQIWFPPDRERIPGRVSRHWADWFESFTARTLHYARIAQETGCEMYGLDSELDLTVPMSAQWKKVIAAARSVYRGPIDSCHTKQVDVVAELRKPDHWFHDLDSLGYSYYPNAADHPGATLEHIVEKLRPTVAWHREAARLFGGPGKAYYFGECGCTSSTGGAMNPSGWKANGAYAPEEQERFAEAVGRLFWNEPWWGGLFWWKWDEQLDRAAMRSDPAGDKGFTVHGKPAEETLRRWFACTRS